mmetsp:Transcript_27644/g.49905  ORF Transcript_27644/g.49905 Transcript_27644/m.49905 type:complete len:586 (-) Transcript_27644:889-2646(-)
MGQTESRRVIKHRATNSDSRIITARKFNLVKIITVRMEHNTLTVEVPDEQMTCGWLFSEVIRKCNNSEAIVALKTCADNEIVDYYLTQYDRQLIHIKDREEITVVMRQDMPAVLCKEQYDPIKVIGKGGFSRVLLVRRKDSGQLYAMKVIKKHFIAKAKKILQIATERRVMGFLRHPFIVELNWAFQSSDELCLVMEFCPGGELFFHLHNIGRFTEDQAKFYFAEVLLALEHLHSLDIIYRDLKPENILLDIDGHIRLADFGLAKDRMQEGAMTYSFCGSPEYMSPEMLEKRGHGRAVDYYSLGALLYEMITGLPPFYSSSRSKMYKQIAQQPLKLPPFISSKAQSILEALLCKNPSERLGSRFGIEEIKAHPWCANIKWDKVLSRKILPPFRPNFKHSNFDPQYLEMSLDDPSTEAEPGPYFEEYNFDKHEVEKSYKVTESTKSSTAINFWSRNMKDELTPETRQDLMMFTQAADIVMQTMTTPRRSRRGSRSPSNCSTPSAVSLPHATFDSIPISPAKLFHSPSTPNLHVLPYSISPCRSPSLSPLPSTIIGGRFDSVKIEAKRISKGRSKALNKTMQERPKH